MKTAVVAFSSSSSTLVQQVEASGGLLAEGIAKVEELCLRYTFSLLYSFQRSEEWPFATVAVVTSLLCAVLSARSTMVGYSVSAFKDLGTSKLASALSQAAQLLEAMPGIVMLGKKPLPEWATNRSGGGRYPVLNTF